MEIHIITAYVTEHTRTIKYMNEHNMLRNFIECFWIKLNYKQKLLDYYPMVLKRYVIQISQQTTKFFPKRSFAW